MGENLRKVWDIGGNEWKVTNVYGLGQLALTLMHRLLWT